MNNNRSNIASVWWLLLLSLIISVCLHLTILLGFWFGDGVTYMHDANFHKPPFRPGGFVLNIIFTFLLAFVIFAYNKLIYRKIDFKPWARMTAIVIGCLLITAMVSYLMSVIRPLLFDNPTPMPFDRPGHTRRWVENYRNGFFRDIFTSVIVIFSWQLIVLNQREKEMAVENEFLVAENMRARYEVLKNQVNPHFMFNSLNTLQGLIAVDKDKAMDYLQQLSKVLRYTLQNKDVVTLDDELGFVNSYCNLMLMRYGQNLKVNYDVDGNMLSYQILPLSIQILIENAIKHNVISDRQPLEINIRTSVENGAAKVVVSNQIQKKVSSEPGNGIGLANLAGRYDVKWGGNLEITMNDNVFKVAVPIKENETKIK